MLKHFLSIHSIVKCSSMAKVCTMGLKNTTELYLIHPTDYGTPNESINQRNVKIWADVADKLCFGST